MLAELWPHHTGWRNPCGAGALMWRPQLTMRWPQLMRWPRSARKGWKTGHEALGGGQQTRPGSTNLGTSSAGYVRGGTRLRNIGCGDRRTCDGPESRKKMGAQGPELDDVPFFQRHSWPPSRGGSGPIHRIGPGPSKSAWRPKSSPERPCSGEVLPSQTSGGPWTTPMVGIQWRST